MEKLDLATYSKEIKESYEKVVNGAAERYAIFTVDKSSALTASEVQDGEIVDFVEEFEDGKVQFGLAKVSAPGSDVKKLVLLGWCPENVPLKSKVSFGANFGEVAKILRGYHVQITARDRDDLGVEDILKTVSDAAGARYSIQSLTGGFKPSSSSSSSSRKASKPVTPVATSSAPQTKPKPPVVPASKPKPTVSQADDDEWDGEEESVVRDFSEKPLQNVESAYKPTKVDIDSLRKGKSDTISSTPKTVSKEEPKVESESAKPLEERIKSYSISDSGDGRLSSLPKYKPSNTVSSRYNEVKTTSFGTKPPAPINSYSDKDRSVGGLSKNFGDSGGKTPAQIWAEKHGQYKTVDKTDDEPVNKSEIESDYVVVPSKVEVEEEAKEEEEEAKEEKEEEEEEEEEKKEYSPPPPPVRRSIPAPVVTKSEPEPEPESEPEVAPSLPQRTVAPELTPAPPTLPSRTSTSEPPKASKKEIKAIAEYDYKKDEDNEIGFAEGELIIEIEFIDEDWWSGKHSKTGEVGLFPSSYVTIVEDSEAGDSKPEEEEEPKKESTGKTAIAEYDYDATEDNELTFKEGDVITDIEFIDEDWWLGTLNGKRNLFPANYVSLK